MKKLILVSAIMLSLVGCSTTDYDKYVSAQREIATSKNTSETARYNALKEFAVNGSDTSKVAAVMALAFANQGGGGQSSVQIAAPQPNQALQWASVLVPALTQAYAIGKNADVAINASNNAMQTSVATTGAFVGMASKIQVAAPNISTVTTTTTDDHSVMTTSTSSADQTMSGTGVLGSGAYTTAANPTTTTNTMSGTGTMGSGAYSTTANPTTTNPATTITVPAGKVCSIDAVGIVNCQ